MLGGTFTISSLGGIGGKFFTPIINHPEVSIMGVSRAYTKIELNNRNLPFNSNIFSDYDNYVTNP